MRLEERKPASAVSTSSIGQKLQLAGFVSRYRNVGKNLKFIVLSDWSGTAQIVFSTKNISEQKLAELNGIAAQSVIAASGTVQKSESEQFGTELLADDFEILSASEHQLPVDMLENTKTAIDKRLDWRPLDLRNERGHAIFKIQAKLVQGIYEYFVNNGFVSVFTPSLMGSGSESGAEMFGVVYFDREAFLRQDPQLHRQLTIAAGFEKIFEIGASWRAEQSHTLRHLCEHRTVVAEMAYISDEHDIMKVEEGMIVSALKRVRRDCAKELELLGKKVKIPKTPFPVISYPAIYDILKQLGRETAFGEEHDWESEKLLGKYVKKTYKTEFFFVSRFPFKVKPFYTMRVDNDNMWARSVDMIYKGIEISTGSQREHRHDKLIANVNEKGMKNISWFTDFFKYGVPPHGGFSMGIERLTMQLLDIENVREAVLFPRDPERLFP